MEQASIVTEAVIRSLARPQSYDRGEDYYERDAVREVTQRGSYLRAAVEGSQYEPYQVRIEVDDTGVVDTMCSCPYDHGGICKHRVAVLLTYIRAPDEISQRPPITELVADADPAELRDMLVELVERRPELAEWIESRLETPRSGDTGDDSREQNPDINRESIRRQVQYVLRSPNERGSQDPYVAVETDVEELRNLIDQAWVAIEASDGETALDVLEPLADELMDEEWLTLSYDDSQGIFEFFDEADRALAEALLTADLPEAARETWEERLRGWKREMESYTHHPPYRVALEAARQGWDAEPIQRAMDGEATAVDLWEGDPPWYAEDLVRARLNVLERHDGIDEYLNLAETADLLDAHVTMLVKEGRVEEAIEHGRTHLASPDDFLSLAKTLREHGQPRAALEVARHGVSLDENGNAELAEWLRNHASQMDDPELALEAAVAAFNASPTLAAYQATEKLAGEEWPDVREELLASLADIDTTVRTARRHVEILLYAERYDDAIDIADQFSDYKVVKPVVAAAFEERPQWTIDACKAQAEPIIEGGKSQKYRYAVQWLETAGKAAQAAGELDEWRTYVEGLKDDHYRKYKLRPMLGELLEEFSDRLGPGETE